jgi:hypothetical protein
MHVELALRHLHAGLGDESIGVDPLLLSCRLRHLELPLPFAASVLRVHARATGRSLVSTRLAGLPLRRRLDRCGNVGRTVVQCELPLGDRGRLGDGEVATCAD